MNPALENTNIESDSDFGAHPVVFTGAVEKDGNALYAEVIINQGVRQLARLAFPPTLQLGNIESWLSENSSKIIGYAIYEKGDPARPIIFAYTWKTSEYPMSVPTQVRADSGESIFFDPQEGQWVLTKKFLIGGASANSPVPRGDKLASLLEELLNDLSDFSGAVAALTVTTPQGPSTIPANSLEFQKVKAKLTAMKERLKELNTQSLYVN